MLKELVLKNRSTRGFDEGFAISRETLEELIDLARLSPSSQNIQPLKYFLSCEKEQNAVIQPLTGWAKALPDTVLPRKGQYPTAFIVVCVDEQFGEAQRFMKDVGICAQTILLGAVEKGLNGCMIGNFNPDRVKTALSLPENIRPALIIALGKGVEDIRLVEMKDGKHNYFRDENDTHYVPKRSLREELLN